ncbi:MAG: efflux RND transporter periplasmic adaptor subunit [Chloroflexota bacterium]|nr:efflux RND transporter periplasmic adaptor subunit [Dehalococcoidia bacterium]MDW8255062.1 efflux RND transporter periplasmic adaptor subunit [Chloroflexota bacterium]
MKVRGLRRAGIAGALVVLVVAACQQPQQAPASGPPQQQPTPARAVEVDIRPAQRGTIQASLSYTGDVRAKAQVAVIPRVAARVERVTVDIGSEVRRGDILVELDRSTLQAQLRQAQGNLQSAQARLESLQNPRPEDIAIARANLISAQERLDKLLNPPAAELEALRVAVANAEAVLKQAQAAYDRIAFEPDAGRRPEAVQLEQATNNYNAALANLRNRINPPQQDVDVARQAVVIAEEQLKKALQPVTEADLAAQRGVVTSAAAGVELAQINVNEATIRAPIDGVVADRPPPVGSTTSLQLPILTIVSKEVEIVLPVEETRLPDLTVGTPAIITVPAYPGQEISGTIASIAPTVDQRSRTVSVRVEPVTQDGKLRPGMFAQVRLVTRERPNVLIVPREAVVQRNNQNVVFTVVDGRARQTPVEVGVSDDRNIEIRSGIDQGVPVIVSGLTTLRDGDVVTPRPAGTPASGGR